MLKQDKPEIDMLIPLKLPQFNIQKALFIVSSRQRGVMYSADKRKLKKIFEIETKRPYFSDKKGLFGNRSGGKTLAFGGVAEIKDDDVKRNLLNELEQELLRMSQRSNFDAIYIFASRHMISEVCEIVPKKWQKLIKMKFPKNYTKSHPLEMLEKLDEELGRRIEKKWRKPKSLEEEKILKKSDQAKKVI